MSEIKIRCSYDQLVAIKDLKPHPENRNKHSEEKIAQYAKILKYQGIRKPIIVSHQSGFMVTGHGLLLGIKHNQWTEAPISYQNFDSDDQETTHRIADNALGLQAELDFAGINFDLVNLGPDFNIDYLGLKDFTICRSEKPSKSEICPKCGYEKVSDLR